MVNGAAVTRNCVLSGQIRQVLPAGLLGAKP